MFHVFIHWSGPDLQWSTLLLLLLKGGRRLLSVYSGLTPLQRLPYRHTNIYHHSFDTMYYVFVKHFVTV